VIVASDGYTPKNSKQNGLATGVYGQINIRSGTETTVTYKFEDAATGEPVLSPPFLMTFYDFDSDKLGACTESMHVSGFNQYHVSNDTELSLSEHDDGSLMVAATEYGTSHDNPISPLVLSDTMKNRAISSSFPAVSEFSITFASTESGKKKPGGRNMLFGGPSSLDCPEQPTCDTLECPAPLVLRAFAEYHNGADSNVCCVERATCATHDCPAGKVKISTAYKTQCEGAVCESVDEATCCEEESVLCSRNELNLSVVLSNNLGGQGPDFDEPNQTVVFGDVFPDFEHKVNLVISNYSAYVPKSSARNGLKGVFGVLNLKSGEEVGLRFDFVNADTGAPEEVPAFLFSLYDLDTGNQGKGGEEYVKVMEYKTYKTAEITDIVDEPEDDNNGFFYGTTTGYGYDNPTDLRNLTETQMQRLVSFVFPSGSSFDILFGTTQGKGGRNIHFSGASSLYCGAKATTTTTSG